MASDHEQPTSIVPAASLSRRQALGALAAGGCAVALGRSLGLTAEPLHAQAPPAIHGEFHGAWPYLLPPSGHYNTFITDGSALGLGIYQDLMEMPLAMYYWHDQTWLWLMATGDAFVDSDKYVVHLRQGARWSDGSPFTAQDVLDTWSLWQLLGHALFDYVDQVYAPDDHTVVFHMRLPSTVVRRYVLHQVAGVAGDMAAPHAHSVYGPWAQRVRTLLTQGQGLDTPEVKALRAHFVQFRPPRMVVSGPFQIDPASMTQGQLTLVRNPRSWAHDRVGFERIVLYNGETATITPVVLAGEVDYATHGFPPATDRAFRTRGFTVITTPTYLGFGLLPNYKRVPALQNKVARQALMYLIDRAQMSPVVEGPGGVPNRYVTGFSDQLVRAWLEPATIAQLNTYPHHPERGLSMLRSIGWRRGADGIWVTPDGQTATWEILAEAEYVDILSLATNVADQLAPYGFKLRVRPVAYTAGLNVRHAGHFALTAYAWGAGDPHPYFAWVADILAWTPQLGAWPGAGFNVVQQTARFGRVDLGTLIRQSARGLDVHRQKDMVQQLALIYNEVVPFLPFVERYGRNPSQPPGAHRVTGWPPPSDPIYLNSPYSDSFVIMLLLTGRLHAV